MSFRTSFFYKYSWKICIVLFFIFLYCEVIIYYVVLLQCTWPLLDSTFEDTDIPVHANPPLVKVMLVADPHLLGVFRGHWFDKLRREWQMHRTFVTSMTLHEPDVVVFLGDLFDEGDHSDDATFEMYSRRFFDLFPIPSKTKLLIAVGNHDVGFHYRMSEKRISRFDREMVSGRISEGKGGSSPFKRFDFNPTVSGASDGVAITTIGGSVFVLVNSMSMQDDKCEFCERTHQRLDEISHLLNCSLQLRFGPLPESCAKFGGAIMPYSRPIVLQHFPLYRPSDIGCNEEDAAPFPLKREKFRPNWDCLSKGATQELLTKLNPRAVFDGHSHHGCVTYHDNNIPEWTVSSFSWRNKNNPSFLLAVFTPNNFAVSKCHMPRENTIFALYFVGALLLTLWTLNKRFHFNATRTLRVHKGNKT